MLHRKGRRGRKVNKSFNHKGHEETQSECLSAGDILVVSAVVSIPSILAVKII
jgi:hypothetical protein